jgi:hypothetical protein
MSRLLAERIFVALGFQAAFQRVFGEALAERRCFDAGGLPSRLRKLEDQPLAVRIDVQPDVLSFQLAQEAVPSPIAALDSLVDRFAAPHAYRFRLQLRRVEPKFLLRIPQALDEALVRLP